MNNNDHSYVKMPLVSTASGNIVGFEVLLRQFNGISLATFNRNPELYSELSFPMLNEIFSLDQAGKIRNKDQFLFINLTPAQLLCSGTLTFLTQLFYCKYQQAEENDQTSQEPLQVSLVHQVNKVVIELTEHDLDCDIDKLKERLLLFMCFGFTFAIDDFGAKASNFQRVFEVDHDFIKLDRGLLFRFNARNSDKAHLHHLVSYFHQLNKKVIVEGVETLEDYEVAKACGADYLQGFHFGLPEVIVG